MKMEENVVILMDDVIDEEGNKNPFLIDCAKNLFENGYKITHDADKHQIVITKES